VQAEEKNEREEAEKKKNTLTPSHPHTCTRF
jgi:hypothetical protein